MQLLLCLQLLTYESPYVTAQGMKHAWKAGRMGQVLQDDVLTYSLGTAERKKRQKIGNLRYDRLKVFALKKIIR